MSALLEIVELESGEIVLRRAEGDGSALVEIKFSDEVRVLLSEHSLDVGKAMVSAGVQAVGEVYGHVLEAHEEPTDGSLTEDTEEVPGVLH
ncbi:MAG: hypothetical protein SV765_01275 [Pseudomonadota bacterium]|nr:hypothetical protein [Pseudomonadales bacterium]MDY6918824.1 hypothetical protein [Pseudomonadota bacterium]